MNIILVIYSSPLKTVWDSFTLLWMILAYIRHACNLILFLIVMIVFAYLLEHSSSCHCSRSLFLIISFILELSDIFWVHLLCFPDLLCVRELFMILYCRLIWWATLRPLARYVLWGRLAAFWPMYIIDIFILGVSLGNSVLGVNYTCWTALRPSAY